MSDAHAYDLADGWCHIHRDYCTTTEDPGMSHHIPHGVLPDHRKGRSMEDHENAAMYAAMLTDASLSMDFEVIRTALDPGLTFSSYIRFEYGL